jgi:hypothetical protein
MCQVLSRLSDGSVASVLSRLSDGSVVSVLSGLSNGSVASVLSRLSNGSVGLVAQGYKRTFISHVTRKDLFRRSYLILLSLLVSLIYLSHLKYQTSQLRFPIIIRSFT